MLSFARGSRDGSDFRSRRRLPNLVLFLFVFAGAPAFAHETIDPVCGMKVDPETSRWKTGYGGDTYYFCREADLQSFQKNPEKYASVLSQSARGMLGEYRLLVKPRTARAGEATKIALTPPVPLPEGAALEALVFELGPQREELKRDRQRLHRRRDSESWVFNRFFDQRGACRLWLSVVLPDGRSDGVGFGFPVADRAETSRPEAGRPLTMGDQHELMKRVGRDWADASAALAREHAESTLALEKIEHVRRDLKRLPEFDLHHFAEEALLHAALGREAEAALADLARTIAAGDLDAARRSAREIDGRHCTRCHLQFRWGIVDDLSRFPDLTRRPE